MPDKLQTSHRSDSKAWAQQRKIKKKITLPSRDLLLRWWFEFSVKKRLCLGVEWRPSNWRHYWAREVRAAQWQMCQRRLPFFIHKKKKHTTWRSSQWDQCICAGSFSLSSQRSPASYKEAEETWVVSQCRVICSMCPFFVFVYKAQLPLRKPLSPTHPNFNLNKWLFIFHQIYFIALFKRYYDSVILDLF